ncbi:glycoside hydrolase family 17 protein [Lepidopterella palustris CBS 459.81]|uniref:Glycoside hydrolase family 17 protein n=1 Tax=Lepidopterella palustris CBS 459.81 TaxID=1314670 RepID=A0A8E2JJF5_9PEZI|nr:glycoside hydrolase family 17 protein [Lepidopterella palustris CBS 459.81]
MKTGFFTFGSLVLLGQAAAQPHKIQHGHPKRDIVTKIFYTTSTVAEVIVWVDTDGVPYSTSTVDGGPATVSTSQLASPTDAASATNVSSFVSYVFASSSTSEAVSAAAVTCTTSTSSFTAPTSIPVQSSTSSPAVSTSSPTALPSFPAPVQSSAAPLSLGALGSSPAASVNAASARAFPIGIAYDPYTGQNLNVMCKSESQIASDFAAMKSYGAVRLYGTDCNQVALGLQHAISQGQKLILGIYIPSEDISQDVQIFSDAVKKYAKGKWDDILLITVGNEKVNDHTLTASAVVDAIGWARGNLTIAHYPGPVGTVDTAPATIGNPQLCEHSDYALVNIHAFFDPNTAAADAGTFVKGQVEQVQKACPNKKVIVTESGWPKRGDTNSRAVPSPANQKAALASLKSVFSDSLILFSAFDDGWKQDSAGTYHAEEYWGFL